MTVPGGRVGPVVTKVLVSPIIVDETGAPPVDTDNEFVEVATSSFALQGS